MNHRCPAAPRTEVRARQYSSPIGTIAGVPFAVAVGALVIAHVFDFLSFLLMTARHGLMAEANPFVIQLFEQLGLPGLTLAKVLAVIIGVSVAVILMPRNRRLAMSVLVFGILAGVVGGISNLVTLELGIF